MGSNFKLIFLLIQLTISFNYFKPVVSNSLVSEFPEGIRGELTNSAIYGFKKSLNDLFKSFSSTRTFVTKNEKKTKSIEPLVNIFQ
jgi:hypothetical protein